MLWIYAKTFCKDMQYTMDKSNSTRGTSACVELIKILVGLQTMQGIYKVCVR